VLAAVWPASISMLMTWREFIFQGCRMKISFWRAVIYALFDIYSDDSWQEKHIVLFLFSFFEEVQSVEIKHSRIYPLIQFEPS